MIKTIKYWPHPELLRSTRSVVDVNRKVMEKFCQDLLDTMKFLGGVGIAVPQSGYAISVFLVSGEIIPTDDLPMFGTARVFINPEILEVGVEEVEDLEGCLSFPTIFLNVKRPNSVRIAALDLDGNRFEMAADGLLAKVLQHEYEHTKGKVFSEHVGPVRQQMVRKKLTKWKKNNDA